MRRYGERTALDGVSVRVPAGSTLVVFGPNGAGKSTLLRVLATLLRPHAGTTTVLGHELPREAWEVRGRVGLLGHEPLLYRDLSARENLRYHARLHDVPGERVDELLDAVGMGRAPTSRCASCRAGWSSASPSAAPSCTTPSCCCSTSRASNLDPAATQRARAADRALERPHARRHEPRSGRRPRRGRPGARPAGRPRRNSRAPASAVRRGADRGAVRVRRATSAVLRKELRLELRTPAVGAGDGAVLASRRS